MSRKNKIDEAFEAMDEQDDAELLADEELDEEDEDLSDELTDEDVVAEVARLDEETKAAIQRTRRAGKVTRGRREARESRAQQRSHNAEYEREVLLEQEASTLMAPPPRPGMEQRWIRVSIAGKNDPQNLARKMSGKQKWVPRSVETIPEGYSPPTISHASMGSVISVLDLILCERPREWGIARRKVIAAKSARQMDAASRKHIDHAEEAGGPGIRRQMHRSKTRGRRPAVQED